MISDSDFLPFVPLIVCMKMRTFFEKFAPKDATRDEEASRKCFVEENGSEVGESRECFENKSYQDNWSYRPHPSFISEIRGGPCNGLDPTAPQLDSSATTVRVKSLLDDRRLIRVIRVIVALCFLSVVLAMLSLVLSLLVLSGCKYHFIFIHD